MRSLIAFCLLASVANAQLTRFVGTQEVDAWLNLGSESGGAVQSKLPGGVWHIDILTDGQSIQAGGLDWRFFSTSDLDHHIGQIDFQLDLQATNPEPLDLNPMHLPYTRAAFFKFEVDADGHYRSLEFESDFSDVLGKSSRSFSNSDRLYFDFADFPESIDMRERETLLSTHNAPLAWHFINLHPTEVEPGLKLASLQIQLPRLTLESFDVAPVTGNDLLEEQRTIAARADFTAATWAEEFAEPMGVASIGGVPEPSSWWLLVISGAAFIWATRLSVRGQK